MSFSGNGVPGRGTDAFGRFPVSNPVTLFDYQSQYDAGPLFWETKLTGTATSEFKPLTAEVDLTVVADGDRAGRQTRQYVRYQPGKSQLVMMTATLHSEGEMFICKRSNVTGTVVDTKVPEADWFFRDTTAATQIRQYRYDLDDSKAQILVIDMEWLGVGSVRVGHVVDGVFVPFHAFHHANVLSDVYMTTANLPLRYEIERVGDFIYKRYGYFDDLNGIYHEQKALVDDNFMSCICGTVISEGGFEESRGIPFSVNNGVTEKTVTTRRPVLSIRPKTTFNSITNRGTIIPNALRAFSSSEPVLLEIVYNGTLANASFASVDANSITEYDVAADGISGGIVVDSLYIPASSNGSVDSPSTEASSVTSRLPLTIDMDGANPINLSIVATLTAGTTTDVLASASWQEIR